MEPEGVVDALRLLHASLADDGVLVDMQPVASLPTVSGSGGPLGELDMRQWVETIAAVDLRFEEALAAGLFRLEHEERYITHDSFDDAEDLLGTVTSWRDTEVPEGLFKRVLAAAPPFTVREHIRLRLLARR